MNKYTNEVINLMTLTVRKVSCGMGNEVNGAQKQAISKMSTAAYIMYKMNPADKVKVLEAYNILAATKFKDAEADKAIDAGARELLSNKLLFNSIVAKTSRTDLKGYPHLDNMLTVISRKDPSCDGYKELYKNLLNGQKVNNGDIDINEAVAAASGIVNSYNSLKTGNNDIGEENFGGGLDFDVSDLDEYADFGDFGEENLEAGIGESTGADIGQDIGQDEDDFPDIDWDEIDIGADIGDETEDYAYSEADLNSVANTDDMQMGNTGEAEETGTSTDSTDETSNIIGLNLEKTPEPVPVPVKPELIDEEDKDDEDDTLYKQLLATRDDINKSADESGSEFDDVTDAASSLKIDRKLSEEQIKQEEEQRRKSLEESDISTELLNDTSGQLDDSYRAELKSTADNVVANIMKVYDALCPALFRDKVRGVFVTNGNRRALLRIGDGESKDSVKIQLERQLAIDSVYEVILGYSDGCIREAPKIGDDGMGIDANWLKDDGTIEYNYMPYVQIRNCMGVYRDKKTGLLRRARTWSEFKPKLRKEVERNVQALLSRVIDKGAGPLNNAIDSIQELYNNIIIANEFEMSKVMRFTVYNYKMNRMGKLIGLANTIVASNPAHRSAESYKIVNNSVSRDGILSTLIITDEVMYKGAINFAYKELAKIVGAGGSIDLANTVLGTRLDGEPFQINLDKDELVSMAIIAGSRSGKGVLTLTLMAAMLAAGCPVIYLDFKPDMAPALWDLERKYTGSKILAIDGQLNRLGDCKPNRGKRYGVGCPSSVYGKVGTLLNVMPYVKGVQLMSMMAKYRVQRGFDGPRCFFILDELQRCGDRIDSCVKALKKEADALAPKKGQEPSEEYTYINRLATIYDVSKGVGDFVNTNGGAGHMTAICLGQQVNATDWKGPFSLLVLRCKQKLLGRGTGGSSQYALDEKTVGLDMIDTGYFAFCGSNIPTAKDTTVIKSLLVLNKADYDAKTGKAGRFTGNLLKNLKGNMAIHDAVIEEDLIVNERNEAALSLGCQVGDSNPLVGFEGLVSYLASKDPSFNMVDRLSAGYNEAYKVLNALGIVGPKEEGYKFGTVEAYLYSASPESLFTDDELSVAIEKGITIYEYLNNGVTNSGTDPDEDPDDIAKMAESGDNILSTGVEDSGETGEAGETGDGLNGLNGEFGIDGDDEEIALGTREEEEQRERDAEDEKIIAQLNKPVTTRKLIMNNYSDKVLTAYLNKFIVRMIKLNKFNYADKQKGLADAALVISNFHYIAIARKCYDQTYELLEEIQSRITSDNDPQNKAKFLLGMLDDMENSNLAYDTRPSEEQMLSYIQKYQAVQPEMDIDMGVGFGSMGEFDGGAGNNLGNGFADDIENMDGTNGFSSGADTNYGTGTYGADTYGADGTSGFDNFADGNNGGTGDFESFSTGEPDEYIDINGNTVNENFEPVGNTNMQAEPAMNQYQDMGRNTGNMGGMENTVNMGNTGFDQNAYGMNNSQDLMEKLRREREMQRQQQLAQQQAMNNALAERERQRQMEEMMRQQQILREPQFDGYNQRVAWNVDNNGTSHFDPRSTMNTLIMSGDSYINVDMRRAWKTLNKFKKVLFESKNGTAYEFRKRWDFILSGIQKRFGGGSLVNRVYIRDGCLIVNNKQIIVDQLVGGEYGIQLEDIISFKRLFKKFPLIRELVVDEHYITNLYTEYGHTAKSLQDNLFSKNKSLQVLSIVFKDKRQPLVIKRDTFDKTAKQIEDTFGFKKAVDDMERVAASKNPLLHLKPVGYKTKALAGSTIEFADKHPSVRKATKFGFTAALAMGLISVVGFPLAFGGMVSAMAIKGGMQNLQ